MAEKKDVTVRLQNELTGALIGLARAIDDPAVASAETWTIMTEGLLATAPDACPVDAAIEALIRKVRAEKERLAPGCSQCMAPCGRTADYDMQALWTAEEEVRALKLRILADLREIAAHIAHAPAQQDEETDVYPLLSEALFKIGYDESVDALLSTVRKVEETKLTWGGDLGHGTIFVTSRKWSHAPLFPIFPSPICILPPPENMVSL